MFQKLSLVALSFLILILSALSGCGSSSPTGTTGGGNGGGGGTTFGTITFSGSGTALIGTSFTPLSNIGGTQWFNINIVPSITYPYDIVIAMQGAGTTLIQVSRVISPTSTSCSWVAPNNPASTAVSFGARSVTFNNLTLLGYASTTNTTLTLNGTLSY